MNIAGQVTGQNQSDTGHFIRLATPAQGQSSLEVQARFKKTDFKPGNFFGHPLCSRGYYTTVQCLMKCVSLAGLAQFGILIVRRGLIEISSGLLENSRRKLYSW